MINDVPIGVLFQQAIDLKSSLLDQEKRKFDSWPSWYRNSLFAKIDVIETRKYCFQDKLIFSNNCRELGNQFFGQSLFYEAINQYERALSVWLWIESTKANWKNEAIEDKDILEYKYYPSSKEEIEVIKTLKVKCILNIASSFLNVEMWKDAKKASSSVIDIDPQNAKAFFIRAKASILPKSSGLIEWQIALQDITEAKRINPSDKKINELFKEIKENIETQILKDKSTFGNFLNKKNVLTNLVSNCKRTPNISTEIPSLKVSYHSLQQDFESLDRQISNLLSEEDSQENIIEIKKLKYQKEKLTELMKEVNQRHLNTLLLPNEEMIKEAKASGLDLTDSRNKDIWTKICKEYQYQDLNDPQDINLDSIVKDFYQNDCEKFVSFVCSKCIDSSDKEKLRNNRLSHSKIYFINPRKSLNLILKEDYFRVCKEFEIDNDHSNLTQDELKVLWSKQLEDLLSLYLNSSNSSSSVNSNKSPIVNSIYFIFFILILAISWLYFPQTF